MNQPSRPQLNDLSMLLGAAAHRNGGVVELTVEEMVELSQLYGDPCPLIMGRDSKGVFAALFTLERMVEEGWVFVQRTTGLPEAAARLIATSMRDGIATAMAAGRAEEESAELARKAELN